MPTTNDGVPNVDRKVAAGFGREWSTFRQGERDLSSQDREVMFRDYFRIFPWDRLSEQAKGIDVGCGSGRWASMVAPRVGHLHILDASTDALEVAKENLRGAGNVTFHLASAGAIPLPDRSLDFAYSLGVLHHVPDTGQAIREVARILRQGAPFLIYLYYAFDNRPLWYRVIWRASDIIRVVMSRLPHAIRLALSQIIAALVYWPLARLAHAIERRTGHTPLIPLAWYRDKDFYVMRTDAYDRFCTRLEKRFSRPEIAALLQDAGFRDVTFSESEPYWCAAGIKHDKS